MTNTERRVQPLHPVVSPPGEARPDWQILGEVAARFDRAMGRPEGAVRWRYPSSAAILEELASVTPIYGGISSERLDGVGLQWPCPAPDHPGTPILHAGKFSRGRGKFHATPPFAPAEPTDDAYPLTLTTGRLLHQYHTGTMTRRSRPLSWREPSGRADIHPDDAAAIGLQDGGAVVIKSRRGEVHTVARLTDRVPKGTVFLAFHWREAPANLLTQDFALDPVAKIPEYKISAVRLENPRQGVKRRRTTGAAAPEPAAG